jgi:hypothetical protein
MNNTINALNLLNFNQFVENVVEEGDDQGFQKANANLNAMDTTNIFGVEKGEDEKLTNALHIALEEIEKARDEKKADLAQDEEGMADPNQTMNSEKSKKPKDKEKLKKL